MGPVSPAGMNMTINAWITNIIMNDLKR